MKILIILKSMNSISSSQRIGSISRYVTCEHGSKVTKGEERFRGLWEIRNEVEEVDGDFNDGQIDLLIRKVKDVWIS